MTDLASTLLNLRVNFDCYFIIFLNRNFQLSAKQNHLLGDPFSYVTSIILHYKMAS